MSGRPLVRGARVWMGSFGMLGGNRGAWGYQGGRGGGSRWDWVCSIWVRGGGNPIYEEEMVDNKRHEAC